MDRIDRTLPLGSWAPGNERSVVRRVKSLLAITMLPWLLFSAGSLQASLAQVQDSALQRCIQQIAEEKNWTSPGDFLELKCHNQGIKSLAGLEQFANLQSLSLYNNKIKQINFSLTQFPKLTTLNLARNQLGQLEFDNSVSLEKLYLFANGLKTLKLKNLTQLQEIKTHNNRIETFSYFNTPRLAKVYIFNNKLKTIDIYNLPALQYMDCRENPMPDELYDEMDRMEGKTILHDGNAEDW